MSEVNVECLACSNRYLDILRKYRRQKKKIRKMKRAFARIECALLHKCDHYTEHIVGECETFRSALPEGCEYER